MEKDLEENTLFRIKWPRGEMGSLPADSEQFMMLEDIYKSIDRINKQLESMMNNKINIEFLRGQMDKVLVDIEALKDKNREMYYNGNGKKYSKGKKYDGRSRPANEAYKNGWNAIFLNKVMKEEVDINANGSHKYTIKEGPNKGKVL